MPSFTRTFPLVLTLVIASCPQPEDNKADAAGKAVAKADAKVVAKPDVKAQTEPKAKVEETATSKPAHINVDEQGRALRGFDPLAYRTQSKPAEGKAEFTFEWSGAKWQFASEQNMKAFSEAPEKYAPANGGYCTFGVVLGKKFDGDPKVWLVKDESLYVFLNEEVKQKFLSDEAGNLEKVRSTWPNIKDRSPAELEG